MNNLKGFLVKFIRDKTIFLLLYIALIAFGIYWFFFYDDWFLKISSVFAAGIYFCLNLIVIIPHTIIELRRVVLAVMDCLTKYKTKSIPVFVEKVLPAKFEFKNRHYGYIKARNPSGKKVSCLWSKEICSEDICKSTYYSFVVTKYSNLIVDVTIGKDREAWKVATNS